MSDAVDVTGQRYGRLTALRFVGHRRVGGQTKRVWALRCDCGREVELVYGAFSTGLTRSCGCLVRTGTHKEGGASIYHVWHAMVERCRNLNHAHWPGHGGQGIKVCDRWLSYSAFRDDMGPRPPGTVLERERGDVNYEPGNCRWAAPREQANRSGDDHGLTLNGETLSLSEWARRAGMTKGCLHSRLEAGWPLERALNTPSAGNVSSRSTAQRQRA